jgi:hypothetical protein
MPDPACATPEAFGTEALRYEKVVASAEGMRV